MAVISQVGESSGAIGRLRQLKDAALGSGLGVIVVGVGILLIGIGWNGMAGGGGEINGVPNLNAQLPWLVSGGLLGLAFVVFGSAIVVAHNARVDRARLEAKLDEMAAALERSAHSSQGESSVVFRPEPRAQRAAPPAPRSEVVVVDRTAPVKKASTTRKVAPVKTAAARKRTTR